jgi:predicted amidohydrolase
MDLPRRHLLKLSGAATLARSALALGLPASGMAQGSTDRSTQRVAAIQFEPKLGDINANLSRADALVREALNKGARWVVLPEFFPTGTAMHPSLFDAYQPVDGRPAEMLRDLAKLGRAYVSGSFMARSGGDAFNTLVLACPDGSTFTHDKDFPTMVFESAFYAGGEDGAYADRLGQDGARTASQRVPARAGNSADGAFTHAGTGIGAALCWEIARNRTARRLVGKVDILLASSGWWTADPERDWPGLRPDMARVGWNEHQALIDAAPPRMARMLGVPVVHANFAGRSVGYATLAMDREANGRYLGSSQIVDADGKTVARLGTEQGVLMADVAIGRKQATDKVSEEFWLPEVSEAMLLRWATTGAAGRDFYLKETRARLAR